MNPDEIKIIFDTWAVTIMMLWGIVVKYFPKLGAIPNAIIGWTNLIGYILAKLVIPDAHAADSVMVGSTGVLGTVPDIIGIIIGGVTNAGWAMVLYETFGRTFLEKLLKLKKNG